MENYYLEGTIKTPMIHFEYDTGNLTISGRSIPENSIQFYQKAMDWLDEYIKAPQADTEFTVKLEYFNTSSSKCLVEIFRKLEGIYNDGKIVNIMWFYEEVSRSVFMLTLYLWAIPESVSPRAIICLRVAAEASNVPSGA